MNLKRQLLLVSLLTLVLPWAGTQLIRETESALRAGQQEMLAGTARAIADALAQYPEEFPEPQDAQGTASDQLYGHPLRSTPRIDGYFDDWNLDRESLRSMRGADGSILFATGVIDESMYLYVEAPDRDIVFALPGTQAVDRRNVDRVRLSSVSPPYREESLVFAAEAPGPIVTYRRDAYGFEPVTTIQAHWQDTPGGYRLEARIPLRQLGTHLGLEVSNANSVSDAPVRSRSFSAPTPGPYVTASPDLQQRAAGYAQRDVRITVTDANGWRLAEIGQLESGTARSGKRDSVWKQRIYGLLFDAGQEAALARPDASGREQQAYVAQALDGQQSQGWFLSAASGRAVVAVAQPISNDGQTIGAIVLQQGTDAILSRTNQVLSRLINLTLAATVLVALSLLGYATWLSRRIRQLSIATEVALHDNQLQAALPSENAADEIGDLSRSFSSVLQQLGSYNEYLRTLASKLSHELRTPLAIVTSSLENLEHEDLDASAAAYATRARDGADRLRRILTAMSEASRVEELMQHAESEDFDLQAVLQAAADAYRDVYPQRHFVFEGPQRPVPYRGSPELLVQMLDKLVDNAADFSKPDDTITLALAAHDESLTISVTNPGPPLPERMRTQLFDSMVSVRTGGDNQHLGLGLYVARLIATGHHGSIAAENTEDGVRIAVNLPLPNHAPNEET